MFSRGLAETGAGDSAAAGGLLFTSAVRFYEPRLLTNRLFRMNFVAACFQHACGSKSRRAVRVPTIPWSRGTEPRGYSSRWHVENMPPRNSPEQPDDQ